MVHTRLAALHVPSVREELHHRKQHHGAPIAITSRSIAVPYPVGASTLQVTGVHLRLVDVVDAATEAVAVAKLAAQAAAAAKVPGTSSRARSEAAAGSRDFQFFGGAQPAKKTAAPAPTACTRESKASATPSARASVPAKISPKAATTSETTQKMSGAPLAVNVVIRVQTQPAGAAAAATEAGAAHHTRDFVAAIVPLQLGGGDGHTGPHGAQATTAATTTSSSSLAATTALGKADNTKTFPAPYRPAKKGPRPPKHAAGALGQTSVTATAPVRPPLEDAPVSASAFVKMDMRLQVERVRFVIEVWPGMPDVSPTPAAGTAGQDSSPYRRRHREAQDGDLESTAVDASLDVVVVGTVSSLV